MVDETVKNVLGRAMQQAKALARKNSERAGNGAREGTVEEKEVSNSRNSEEGEL